MIDQFTIAKIKIDFFSLSLSHFRLKQKFLRKLEKKYYFFKTYLKTFLREKLHVNYLNVSRPERKKELFQSCPSMRKDPTLALLKHFVKREIFIFSF